jgi:hypothetical protein
MGGVKTGRVKGARLRKNPGTNVQLRGRGDSGCDSGGGWGAPPPDASASRMVGTHWVGGTWGRRKAGEDHGRVQCWHPYSKGERGERQDREHSEQRAHYRPARQKGWATTLREGRGTMRSKQWGAAKARQVHPRWSASDMAEGLSATSPRASTPSPPGVLAAA